MGDITLEERRATDSVTSASRVPASCPPKRRSLIQENMNEEVVIEDMKKGPTKEKLVGPKFEGRDNSERNANVEQRLERKKRPQKEEEAKKEEERMILKRREEEKRKID